MNDTPTKQILRWLAVLPGAILAGLIVLFPVHWAAMFIHYFGDSGDSIITTSDGKGLIASIPLESLERFLDALFVPGAVVAAGAKIAPKFHFITSVILTALFVGFISYLFASISSDGSSISDSPLRIIFTVILWLVSVGYAIFYARELDKRNHFDSEYRE